MKATDRRQSERRVVNQMLALVIGLVLGASPAVTLGAAKKPIILDGSFGDWKGIKPVASDARGDGADGAVDLGRIWLRNSGYMLFLRFEGGRETILQNPSNSAAGNQLRIVLDLDDSGDTGLPEQGLGAEVEVRFGDRQISIYDAQGDERVFNPGRGWVVAAPTHSALTFELKLDLRALAPADLELPPLPTKVRLFVEEQLSGGDRLPDVGTLSYELKKPGRPKVSTLATERDAATDLRILTLNVEDSLVVRRRAIYRRLLKALRPDVINLQELRLWDAGQTRDFVADTLGEPAGGRWQASMVADCVTVSVFEIVSAAPVDGNLLVYLDLPDTATGHDLILFNVHTPCCDNEQGRDVEHDHLAATWRDLLADQGPLAIDRQDAVVFAGDFNMVGYQRQLGAVRDGRLIDPANGPDFKPGRKKGSLAVARLRHTDAPTTVTWRRRESPFAPGRLDWVFYSSDRLKLQRSYVLDTAELSRKALKKLKLRRQDSLKISDHLVLITDFSYRGD